MLGADGKVYPFGSAAAFGDPTGLDGSAVSIAPTPDNKGYWIVDDDRPGLPVRRRATLGSVAAGTLIPGELVTGLSATPTGKGYWLFTTRGRVVAFGDAHFYGDMPQRRSTGRCSAASSTPTGKGYYMVGSDGGIFTFGDAAFRGSMGGKQLNQPVGPRPHRRPAAATGSSPPTAASSPSATPRSAARWARRP